MPPVSPKLTPRDKRSGLYPYYAGYSEAFADWALDRMEAVEGKALLDPWNGTGTTTAVGAARGMIATGIDINPVLSFVAKARMATAEDREQVREWARGLPARSGRVIDEAVHAYHQIRGKAAFVQGSPSDALFVVGMFPTVRRAFQLLRTKNPSWYSEKRVAVPDLARLATAVDDLKNGIIQTCLRQEAQRAFSPSNVTLINSDLQLVSLPPGSYDYVLTSPPYLTRIDYVQATLPELCLLDAIEISTPRSYLRRRMIGTPLTSEVLDSEVSCLPPTTLELLQRIKKHRSKASHSYYWRFFSRYFLEMSASIAQVADALRTHGQACIVTQPSFYKDIFVDLPMLLSEIAHSHGLEFESGVEFDSKNSMVSVNRRAQTASRARPNETAAFYRRIDGNDK